MDNGDPFTVFLFEDFGFSESKIFFGQGKCSTASRPIYPYDVVVDVIHVADMDEAYGTYAADDE